VEQHRSLVSPSAQRKGQTPVSDGTKKSPTQEEIDRLQSLAQAARDYHTTFPAAIRAVEARKIEVMAELQAAQLGASDPPGRVRGLVQSFRSDKNNSLSDRVDVAMAAEYGRIVRVSSEAERIAKFEAVADTLFDEFGGTPQVYAQYVSLLRTTPPADAARIAAKLQKKPLPEDVKKETERVLAQTSRIGRPVELVMSTLEGERMDFVDPTRPTVVFFWNVWNGIDDLLLPSRLTRPLPAGLRWIFVGLGGKAPDSKTVSGVAAFTGKHCHDPAGLAGSAAATMGIMYAPSIAVLAPGGKLVGIGAVEQLPQLVEAAR
jgi:hypothetical protein